MEDLTEGLELTSIERKYQTLVIDINEAAHNIPGLPARECLLALTAGVEPHQLAAPVVGLAVLVITNPVPDTPDTTINLTTVNSPFMVEKLGIFGRPPNLHHSTGDEEDLVVPEHNVILGRFPPCSHQQPELTEKVHLTDSKLLASHLASRPLGPILRYSDTSLVLSIMLI